MGTEIAIALITGGCAIISNMIISRSESKKNDAKRFQESQDRAVKQAIKDTELQDRLKSIETKLEEHNGYAEKFAAASEHLVTIDKILVSIQKDLEYIKQKGA